jgi:glycosyltransferase involved in cell wall biosynthesis
MARFDDAPRVSISDDHRKPLPSANWMGTVYHGMPANSLEPSFEPATYLAFLGRLTKEKGPETAIHLAKAAGVPLRMAAKIPRSETRYYRERLHPIIGGEQIKLVGEVNDVGKGELLRGAAALLFLIDWPEPFGLVMIEAMACGTPVIAFRRGSVPEVIDEGITGFIVDNEEEALAAIRRVPELDRRTVRATFERRFTARRMAEDYVRLFERLLRQQADQPRINGAAVLEDALGGSRPSLTTE